MMEVNCRKVWICLAKGSSGKYTGYFSSVVESINVHAMNFVACPGAQFYWWLRRRGCLAEDVSRMVCHCFMLDQQQKMTKSKYISDKGYAVFVGRNGKELLLFRLTSVLISPAWMPPAYCLINAARLSILRNRTRRFLAMMILF